MSSAKTNLFKSKMRTLSPQYSATGINKNLIAQRHVEGDLFLYFTVYSRLSARRSIDRALTITPRPLTPFRIRKHRWKVTAFHRNGSFRGRASTLANISRFLTIRACIKARSKLQPPVNKALTKINVDCESRVISITWLLIANCNQIRVIHLPFGFQRPFKIPHVLPASNNNSSQKVERKLLLHTMNCTGSTIINV